MTTMDQEVRRRLSAIKAEERALKRPFKEAQRKQRRADRRDREKRTGRALRDRDETFIGWLHEGLPCIACLLFGPPADAGRIEAAHQKINAPSRGLQKRLGVRPSDMWCVPLCESHHRVGPLCCDPAQAKFWGIVGLTPEQVADLCAALYRAFEGEEDGAPIIRDFASLAAAQRMEAAP